MLAKKTFETNLKVNSAHQQAILKLGDSLIVEAVSPDKIIEAIRHDQLPIYAVQWHPEQDLEDKINRVIFEIWEGYLSLPLKS